MVRTTRSRIFSEILIIIPLASLSDDILNNIIESYVLQEGTEYGASDVSLRDKVAAVKQQLKAQTALLVYSELHETVNIVPADQFKMQQANEENAEDY